MGTLMQVNVDFFSDKKCDVNVLVQLKSMVDGDMNLKQRKFL